jgi:proline iminopeptidase
MGNVRHFFEGLAAQYPAAWAALDASSWACSAGAPALLDRLAACLGADPVTARRAALAWWRYEQHISAPHAPPPPDPDPDAEAAFVRKYRLQAHYLQAGCFLDEAEFLARCRSLHLPVHLMHGLDDQVCPPGNTRRLAESLPQARVRWVAGCGHDPFHGEMVRGWSEAMWNE